MADYIPYIFALSIDEGKDLLIEKYSENLPDHRLVRRNEVMGFVLLAAWLEFTNLLGEKSNELVKNYCDKFDLLLNNEIKIENNSDHPQTLTLSFFKYMRLFFSETIDPIRDVEMLLASDMLIIKEFNIDTRGDFNNIRDFIRSVIKTSAEH